LEEYDSDRGETSSEGAKLEKNAEPSLDLLAKRVICGQRSLL